MDKGNSAVLTEIEPGPSHCAKLFQEAGKVMLVRQSGLSFVHFRHGRHPVLRRFHRRSRRSRHQRTTVGGPARHDRSTSLYFRVWWGFRRGLTGFQWLVLLPTWRFRICRSPQAPSGPSFTDSRWLGHSDRNDGGLQNLPAQRGRTASIDATDMTELIGDNLY